MEVSLIPCSHDHIARDGSCSQCGVICASFNFDRKCKQGVRSRGERSIIHDLECYNFPEDIKYTADEIFHKIRAPTKRGKERSKMLFFLVYSAYREKNIPINPNYLGKEMKLTPGDVNRALNTFSEAQTGYRPPLIRTTPLDAITQICSHMNITHFEEEIIGLGEEVLSKVPFLGEELPYKVAAGIIRYYMECNGIQMSPSDFRQHIDFSDVTIKDIHERITKIHNS